MNGSSVADSQNNDGLGRIRTGDLRRVKTEALAQTPLFLDRSEVFLDPFADDTTTRNASAHHAPLIDARRQSCKR